MSQHKYYTPTVEDLVWGLEMEYMTKHDYWAAITFDEKISISLIQGLLYQSKLRIKHLDELDILELGWIVKDNYFIFGKYWLFINDWSDVTISNEGYPIFTGKCRNKAELKRLMSQLKIM